MPIPAYMSIVGYEQGAITKDAFTAASVGNIWQEGHEDEVMVQAFSHHISIPRDPQSGQPTGQRVHQPMTITKIYDKSSPMLFTALTTGERLTKVEINWYRMSEMGVKEAYFTHLLEDAVIVDIRATMPNCQDPSNDAFTHMEEVSFTYRKITWTHIMGQTFGSDDWRVMRDK